MTKLITGIDNQNLSEELRSNENKIRQADMAWHTKGKYLTVIHDEQQFMERGYTSWDDYSQRMLDISRSMSYKIMSSYAVYEILKGFGYTGQALPKTESQARPMAKLLDEAPDKIKEVWQEVLADGNRVTAQRVTILVQKKLGIIINTEPKKKTTDKTIPNNTGVVPAKALDNDSLDTAIQMDAEIEVLEARIIELESELLKARKNTNGKEKSKMAIELIRAGFKALSNTIDASQMDELIATKTSLMG